MADDKDAATVKEFGGFPELKKSGYPLINDVGLDFMQGPLVDVMPEGPLVDWLRSDVARRAPDILA